MTTFWFCAGSLLIIATALLLIPALRHPRTRADANRTGMNVGVYRERMIELQDQHEDGILDAAQLDVGRTEAARELLDDTQGTVVADHAPLGRVVPVVAAFATPLLALAMYMHWGASDALGLVQQHRGEPAQNIANVTSRLEALLAERPDSPEGWSLLGRAYMAQERVDDAARAYERAANLAGRPSQLLGQWAQALYLAQDQQWTPQLQALIDEALSSNPQDVLSLSVAAMGTFRAQQYNIAINYWKQLEAILPEGDPNRAAINANIARASKLAEGAELSGK